MSYVRESARRPKLDEEHGEDGTASEEDHEEDHIDHEPEPFPEDMYSVAMACYIRDLWHYSNDTKHKEARVCRMLITTLVAIFTIGLQAFLVYETKVLVTPEAVNSARAAYGRYEKVMYTDPGTNTSHTYLTVNGFDRGIPGFFHEENFDHGDLSDDEKATACRIPFSQPVFFGTVLMLWSLTCISEIRKTIDLMLRLCNVPRISSMADALRGMNEEEGKEGAGPAYEVVGLTLCVKGFLVGGLLIPRLGIGCFLLYLGSRWLAATLSFGDVLLNAVALEFILLLREMLYPVVVPFRVQQEVQNTMLPHVTKRSGPGIMSFVGMFGLLVVAILWSVVYMVWLQKVLPDYHWDVRKTCAGYLAKALSA